MYLLLVSLFCRAMLKMDVWLRYPRHMFLRRPSPEDMHLFESEQGYQVGFGAASGLPDGGFGAASASMSLALAPTAGGQQAAVYVYACVAAMQSHGHVYSSIQAHVRGRDCR